MRRREHSNRHKAMRDQLFPRDFIDEVTSGVHTERVSRGRFLRMLAKPLQPKEVFRSTEAANSAWLAHLTDLYGLFRLGNLQVRGRTRTEAIERARKVAPIGTFVYEADRLTKAQIAVVAVGTPRAFLKRVKRGLHGSGNRRSGADAKAAER